MADTPKDQQGAPDTLPADFFQQKSASPNTATDSAAPDTLPADFFQKKEAPPAAVPTAPTYRAARAQGKPKPTTTSLEQQDADTVGKVVNAGEGALDVASRYGKGLLKSVGLPSSVDEYKAAAEDASKIDASHIIDAAGGPALSLAKQAYEGAKKFGKGLIDTGKEAYEAGQNVGEGQPVLPNIAKPVSSMVENTVGAVPFVGEPIVDAGHDIANKNYAGAAGELTGAIGQVVAPELTERLKVGRSDIDFHLKKVEAASKALKEAQKLAGPYSESVARGESLPPEVQKPIDKAQKNLTEATKHLQIVKDAHAEHMKAAAAPAKEVPTQDIEAKPKPKAEAEPVLTPEREEVREQARRKLAIEHPRTAVEQPLTEKPLVPLGQRELAGGQGTVGMPKLLPEAEEGGLDKGPTPDRFKSIIPDTPKQEVLPPEKPKAAKPERGNLRALTVDDAGKVVDKEESTPEGKLGRLLKESLTTDKQNPSFPAIKVTSEEVPREPVKKAEEPAKVEPVKLPEDKTSYEPKKEEVVPAGAEGREPAKSAAEYHPAVEEQVSHLSDDNLRKLAKAHGLNPDEYDFKTRDDHRHRTERDQLVKDIAAQIDDDEKVNIGRNAERLERDGKFQGKDMSGKGKAERAASLFPRLRGPVDEFGNPTVAGGAPDGAAAPAEDEEAKRLKAHVEKTSSKDTDHIQAAMQELGKDAKLSDVMKRAQELKDSESKPADLKSAVAEHNKKEGLPPVKDNKLEIDPRGKEIARAYDDLKHNPSDPETKKSYEALKKDADKQWDALEAAGIKLEPTDEDPYKSHEEMKEDFEKNKRLKVFRGGNPLPEDHPLAQVDPKTGETYNVKFRAVHDAIGHLMHDNDFSEKGETNAFDTHRQTMSKEAIPAMTTETKGQVAHFFNKEGGPNGEFPEQKAGLLPERFYDESPEAKPVLDHIKSGKDFALLTAENPGTERATPEANAQRNKEMKAELEKMGYKPVPVEGHNADVKGEKENSFFVPDIKPADAEKISKKYGQASVLTKIGIHDLEKNEIHPAGKMIEGPEAAKQDYHSTVGGKAFAIPVNFDTTVAGDIGRWSAPPELGAFSAEDKGQNIRAENERRMGGPLKRGEVERRGGEDRRGVDRTKQKAEQDLFNSARKELGEDATSEEVSKLADHLRDLPKATAENSRLSDEELLKKGYSQEDLDKGRHLPTVSGAKEGTAKAKKLPTGDELIEKYGESNGDPAHTTFILADGRGVANTGTDHDIMLGGRATDKIPPREKFVDQGNIRVRPRPTGTKGREVSMSLPEKGINQKQLDYILKMAPQLRSGVVGLEVGKRGGAYKILPYGEATDEALKSTIRELVPVLNDKGAPIDEFGNPTVSGGSQAKDKPTTGKVNSKGELVGKPEKDSPADREIKMSNPVFKQDAPTTVAQNEPPENFTHEVKDVKALRGVKDASTIIVTPEGKVHMYNEYNPSAEQFTHSSLFNQVLSYYDKEHAPELDKYQDEDASPYDPSGNYYKFQEAGGVRAYTTGPDEAGVEIHSNAPAGTIAKALRVIDNLGRKDNFLEIADSDNFKRVFSARGTYEQIKNAVHDWADEHGLEVYPGEKDNPTVSGGSQSAGTAPAKEEVKESPESLRNKLPKIAQENLTEQEKEGLTTTPSNKARTVGTNKFVDNMEKIPEVQEYVDIALQGEGARKWYSRSRAAFDAMAKVAPDVFKKGDLDKFLGMLAGTSPQQSVAMNLREALGFWKEWHEAGRPELSLDKWKQFGEAADKAWKEDGSPRVRGLAKGASMHWDYAPKGDEWKAENLLLKTLTLPETKVPNLIKAMSGEDMWPDLTKNSAFKAPSFAQNLRGWKNYVTNDSWMGLFGGIDKSALSKPENYHPLSVATRAAAKELGWEPEEAQAAIWSFTQALTEKGAENPHDIRQYSEDFKDLMENDLQVRNLLEDLGVNLNDLDDHLRGIEEKPEVSGRTTASTSRSIGKLKERIEEARGRGAIPKPKTAQGSLLEQFHKERPSFEQRNKIRDADVEFNPKDFGTEDDKPLKKLGEKKNKPKMKSLF